MAGGDLIPFVIGVTGHRDPEPGQLPALREKFERILAWVHEHAPDTPILLLCGLAAGCDQLAARWALEWSRSQGPLAGGVVRIRLGCLLPLERDEYLKDFENDPEALAGFRELESQAAFVVSISSLAGHAESKSDGSNRGQSPAGESRDGCYERLGRFLADRSQLLVAFWNRVDNQKRGGTAHVVMTARRIAREGADRLAIPGRGERHVLASHDVAVIEVIDTAVSYTHLTLPTKA